MVYGYDRIYVERGGRIYTVEAGFTDEAHRGAHRQDSGGYRHSHRDLLAVEGPGATAAPHALRATARIRSSVAVRLPARPAPIGY
jgi:hypothetical protein